ncbi:hypothetical protein AB0891_25515 [Streptomyces sp. NPDC007259]|uniref:hypothetical protein n=1 Tax=Streptomyces sp. NPDC007259 TaxID=3154319 RepID=UPI0034561A74
MSDRIPLDDLTSDQLDALYDQLEQAELNAEQQDRHFRTVCGERESYRQAWKHEQKHRAGAEAALDRARALATRWAILRTHGSAATELRAALDQAQ